ncbi:hypothetical protein [Jannaschia formosa]|uniref:hypothetical protein n=1 Tax=Jannaschia formosa TaxID=2259592 RepID=UPI000E1B7D9E|nr:hypothetical protein [Jannaschia formosa]TFL17016.1 hypothetical protein DR046_17270 [Jannaschia formosa]
MHRQASFIPIFLPEEVALGEDAGFFHFPPFDAEDLGRPVLGSGGLTTMTTDSDLARAFTDFIKLPVAREIMMQQGQFLTPHLEANPEIYATGT